MMRIRLVAVLTALFVSAILKAADVVVTVRDDAGNEITGAYVGVIAEDAAWNEPLQEQVLTDAAATLKVEPGRYRMVTAAAGYAQHYSAPFTVVAKEAVRVNPVLHRLGSVAGRVVDDSGAPIANARIGRLFDFLEDWPRALSEKGAASLGSQGHANSDADGTFEVWLPMNQTASLIAEADKKSPVFLENVGVGRALDNITLRDGASLQMRIVGSPDRAGETLYLVPLRIPSPWNERSAQAVVLWERRIPSKDGSVAWTSLPPGKYEVAVEKRGGFAEDVPLERIATVELQPGQSQALDVTLPGEKMTKGSEPNGLKMLAKGLSIPHISGVLWSKEKQDPIASKGRTVSGGLLFNELPPCTSGDRYVLESKSEMASFEVESCSGTTTVEFRPRATLLARFVAPAKEALPPRGLLHATNCKDVTRNVEVPFAIGAKGDAAIPIPAGCHDLRFQFRALAAPKSKVTLEPGAKHSLDTIELTKTGTIVLRVDVASGRAKGIAVRSVRSLDLAKVRRFDRLGAVKDLASGVVDENGWVTLAGLPGGEQVTLVLTEPKAEVSMFSPSYQVETGQELVTSIWLPSPASVKVSIKKPDHLSKLAVRGITAEFLEGDGTTFPRYLHVEGKLESESSGSFPALVPGKWKISALARLEHGLLQDLGDLEIHLSSSEAKNVTLELDTLIYRGTVLRKDGPINVGNLTIWPVDANETQSSVGQTVMLHDGGKFEVMLPTPGDYRVSVEFPRERIAIRDPIHFKDHSQEVQILIPDSGVEGRVTGPSGDPLSNVPIAAVPEGTDVAIQHGVFASTRADGSYRLIGLYAGTWTIRAMPKGLTVTPRQITLSESQRVGSVDFVATPSVQVPTTDH